VLAERRRAHFLDLYESGRWRRYYDEEQFLYRMREAIGLAERWAEIASRSVGELAPGEGEPAPDTSPRTAA
jgi:uncharacterized repeat protein (TIGR03809 family)